MTAIMVRVGIGEAHCFMTEKQGKAFLHAPTTLPTLNCLPQGKFSDRRHNKENHLRHSVRTKLSDTVGLQYSETDQYSYMQELRAAHAFY